jgi:hypothetical protein
VSGDPFQLDARRVRTAFDAAADDYDAVAVVQAEVRRRLLERLELFRISPARILEAGCGTGHGARALCGTIAAPGWWRWTWRRPCCRRRGSAGPGCAASTRSAPTPPRCHWPTSRWTWCSPT